jgi:hypothetical protein
MTKSLLSRGSSNALSISASTSSQAPQQLDLQTKITLVSPKKGTDGASTRVGYRGRQIPKETVCIRDRIIREGIQKELYPRAMSLISPPKKKQQMLRRRQRQRSNRTCKARKDAKSIETPVQRQNPDHQYLGKIPRVKASQAMMIIERCAASNIRCGGADLTNIMNGVEIA